MSVKIRGMNKLLTEMESRLGKLAMLQITDEALKKGAKVFIDQLKLELESFKDTGATIQELTVSEPYWDKGVRTIKVHWKGPKNRYAIIHLNEFGTIKNPNPRGKGAIARALKNSERAYGRAVRQAIRSGLQ